MMTLASPLAYERPAIMADSFPKFLENEMPRTCLFCAAASFTRFQVSSLEPSLTKDQLIWNLLFCKIPAIVFAVIGIIASSLKAGIITDSIISPLLFLCFLCSADDDLVILGISHAYFNAA